MSQNYKSRLAVDKIIATINRRTFFWPTLYRAFCASQAVVIWNFWSTVYTVNKWLYITSGKSGVWWGWSLLLSPCFTEGEIFLQVSFGFGSGISARGAKCRWTTDCLQWRIRTALIDWSLRVTAVNRTSSGFHCSRRHLSSAYIYSLNQATVTQPIMVKGTE